METQAQKFTPAPWRSETVRQHGQDYDSVWIRGHGEDADALNEDNMTIARLTGCRNAEANARLIAAAPELFEALRNLIGRLPVGFDGMGNTPGVNKSAREAAVAAITKATGTN